MNYVDTLVIIIRHFITYPFIHYYTLTLLYQILLVLRLSVLSYL